MIEELRKELVRLTTSDKDNGLERIDTPIGSSYWVDTR